MSDSLLDPLLKTIKSKCNCQGGPVNVGEDDQKVRRIAAGVAGVAGLFLAKGWFRVVLLAVAGLLGYTATTRSCPAYRYLGVNTAA